MRGGGRVGRVCPASSRGPLRACPSRRTSTRSFPSTPRTGTRRSNPSRTDWSVPPRQGSLSSVSRGASRGPRLGARGRGERAAVSPGTRIGSLFPRLPGLPRFSVTWRRGTRPPRNIYSSILQTFPNICRGAVPVPGDSEARCTVSVSPRSLPGSWGDRQGTALTQEAIRATESADVRAASLRVTNYPKAWRTTGTHIYCLTMHSRGPGIRARLGWVQGSGPLRRQQSR